VHAPAFLLAKRSKPYRSGYRSLSPRSISGVGITKKIGKRTHRDINNTPYYFCISYKADNADFLLDRLDQGISVLRKNGVYADILEKHGIQPDEPKPPITESRE